MEKIQITDPRVQQALVLYKSGKGVKFIAQQLHMDKPVITRFLKREGIYRTQAEVVRMTKSKAIINDNALDILTPDALYWIGFLYADGSLEKGRPRITLTISEIDKSHLEKFVLFFGTGLSIRHVQKKGCMRMNYICNAAYRVAFSSSIIYNKLNECGLFSNKTHNVIPHKILTHSRDFWRGVIDGDGWIYSTKVRGVGLCGHENTIRAFLVFIDNCGIKTETSAIKSKRSDHLWSCELHHYKADSVLKLLYENATIYLDRKYQKYQETINSLIIKNQHGNSNSTSKSH